MGGKLTNGTVFLKKFIRDEIIDVHCSSVAAWPLFIETVSVAGYLLICGDNTRRNENSEQWRPGAV